MTVKLIGADDGTIDGSFFAEYFVLCKFTASISGLCSEIRIKVSANGNVKVGLYADSGGAPGARLAKKDAGTAVTTGWNTISFEAACCLTSGTPYWLAFNTNLAIGGYSLNTGVTRYKTATYSTFTFPDPAGTGFTPNDAIFGFIAGWGGAILILYPTGIEQLTALGTPAVSKLQRMILPTGIEQPMAVGTPTLTKVAPPLPDFPDWTMSVRLVGTEIFLPINVQGVSVTIPMDIKAVSIGTISVDIAAQTVGNVTISVAAQVVGVYLQPEWAAKEGQDKNFQATATGKSWGGQAIATYTVPAGKTLYICGISGSIEAEDSADYDHIHACYLWIYNVSTTTTKAYIGGVCGAGMTFPKPIVIPAGEQIRFYIGSRSGVTCTLAVTAWGYEI
jgi:hypothetical protein